MHFLTSLLSAQVGHLNRVKKHSHTGLENGRCNAIHLYVSASGSAISSANLATAEDNLFNLDRRGDQQGALPPVQSANARAVDEPHILMRAFERY
jgi:hypothetical protein